jgi:hypothetical protein
MSSSSLGGFLLGRVLLRGHVVAAVTQAFLQTGISGCTSPSREPQERNKLQTGIAEIR